MGAKKQVAFQSLGLHCGYWWQEGWSLVLSGMGLFLSSCPKYLEERRKAEEATGSSEGLLWISPSWRTNDLLSSAEEKGLEKNIRGLSALPRRLGVGSAMAEFPRLVET